MNRWLAGFLLVAALFLAACTPAEGGDDPGSTARAPTDVDDDGY